VYQLEGYPVPSGIPVGRPTANTIQGRPTPGAEQLRLGDASYPVMSRGERKGGPSRLGRQLPFRSELDTRGVRVTAMRTVVGPPLLGKSGTYPQYACSPGMCYAHGLWVSEPVVFLAWLGMWSACSRKHPPPALRSRCGSRDPS
jgi:hypothetical protein